MLRVPYVMTFAAASTAAFARMRIPFQVITPLRGPLLHDMTGCYEGRIGWFTMRGGAGHDPRILEVQ